jgi:endonuclease/exonuclease/phosphatase family metal-dependent hydrolase
LFLGRVFAHHVPMTDTPQTSPDAPEPSTQESKARRKKRILWVAAMVDVPLIALAIFVFWAKGPALPATSTLDVHADPDARPAEAPAILKVVTYNVGHGQGIKEDPKDYRDKATTLRHLDDLADALKRIDAHIALLQEVDTNADRTHHLDQAKILAEKAGYPYRACATIWDKKYIPFPPAKFIGQVESAICVLSRFPLREHRRRIFDKPSENAFWYNWFYIDRGAQAVVAEVGDVRVTLVNLHLEAWGKDTRQGQANDLRDWIADMPGPMVVAGDFNALPPEATRKNELDDDSKHDYDDDGTVDTIRKLEGFTESIPAEVYSANERDALTYPANAPDRRLDYVFGGKGAMVLRGRVAKEAAEASDHLPIVAEVHHRKGDPPDLNLEGDAPPLPPPVGAGDDGGPPSDD